MPRFENPPYYLTAYGLAVKHGFKGTEKEWLESLGTNSGRDGLSVFYADTQIPYDPGVTGEYAIERTDIYSEGRKIQAGDLILTSNGTLMRTTSALGETQILAEALTSLGAKENGGTTTPGSGADGLSIYYAPFALEDGVIGVGRRDVSEIETSGRDLQVGDLLVTANGMLMRVTAVSDTYDATKVSELANGSGNGADGLSIYYADFALPDGTTGKVWADASVIETSGRDLQVGDLLITTNGVLMRVTAVGTTNHATKVSELATSSGVRDVAGLIGHGTADMPIDLSRLEIESYSTLYFSKGTYYVAPLELEGIEHLTIQAQDAKLVLTGDSFLTARNCPIFRMSGGVLDGNGNALYGIQLNDSENACFEGVSFCNFGSAEKENVSMLNLFGDCTGFLVEQCIFNGCRAGVVSSDGFIHAYGIFVNRLNSSKTHSKNGVIRQCAISDIAGIDSADKKADGDGVFIQAPPYMNDAGETVIPDAKILVQNCTFAACRKRGVKSAARGVVIEDCDFKGEFWYACVDFQYGHGKVIRCRLENTSDYNGSITSAMVASDGGVEVRDSVIRAPYVYVDDNTGESSNTYHPGIRLGKRLDSSVLGAGVHWDKIRIDNCYFDGCYRSVFAYNSEGDMTGYTLDGLEITNCRFGAFNQAHVVELNSTMFARILAYQFTDFRFDYGANRQEVAAVNEKFTYPHSSNCSFIRSFELHSRHWENEPMSGYDSLPTATHTRIVYSGSGMGSITHKVYTTGGSTIRGIKNPDSITETLSRQLLYNSRVGDLYINTSTGEMFKCTTAGTVSTVGVWESIGAGGYTGDGATMEEVNIAIAEAIGDAIGGSY